MRRVAVLMILALASCSAQSTETVPTEDATDTTNATPDLTSTTIAESAPIPIEGTLEAAVAEGSAACAEYEQVLADYSTPGKDFDAAFEALERLTKSMERLDAAIDRVALVDPSVIPEEDLQRWYSALQSGESGEITSLDEVLVKFGEVYLIICDRISQYR